MVFPLLFHISFVAVSEYQQAKVNDALKVIRDGIDNVKVLDELTVGEKGVVLAKAAGGEYGPDGASEVVALVQQGLGQSTSPPRVANAMSAGPSSDAAPAGAGERPEGVPSGGHASERWSRRAQAHGQRMAHLSRSAPAPLGHALEERMASDMVVELRRACRAALLAGQALEATISHSAIGHCRESPSLTANQSRFVDTIAGTAWSNSGLPRGRLSSVFPGPAAAGAFSTGAGAAGAWDMVYDGGQRERPGG